ncbi:AcrR family transcriptional regulator [Motilibacter peucedani]|uniref:AcrR family transcriptional regulator n=1 Tax=Motilibacter peucedani TaxID=598650 RepID=A0A420XST0_9ACTN|nr:TetR/AcrR family transcriptional regulator [Motilibacter peucedani]RKS77867.1 AcrR family transcriptional regulator [Motilibacter peucedani]
MSGNRERILEVALVVLGHDPDAGMGEVAAAAGVVRRTVYGHFPSRAELVQALTRRAVTEIAVVLDEVDAPDRPADAVWAQFIARLWPLVHRYRVLVALRRGEHAKEIHALLGPVEDLLTALVARGQSDGRFGRHLSAPILARLAWGAVFAMADDLAEDTSAVGPVSMASLLLLGVPHDRAEALAESTR